MTILKILTAVALAEAVSWLCLLVAMLFKYGFDMPEGVAWVGPIHGSLFLAFAALLFLTHVQKRWPLRKTMLAFAESIPPFTGFLLGKQLLDDVREEESATGHPA